MTSVTNTGDELPRQWNITIFGTPRTKKTSNEIHLTVHKKYVRGWVQGLAGKVAIGATPGELMRAILMKVKVQPSKLYRRWAKDAPSIAGGAGFPVDCDCHVIATFYRERAIGDLTGYMQGLGDFLQERKFMKNDRLIVNWDGTRLDKDASRPRTEVIIKEVPRGT
jgi:hypothetical protein